MKTANRLISLLAAIVLLVTTNFSALADDTHILTQEELNAAWALTGCDKKAAGYREGMAFSKDMNAHQMREWLDELLSEEVAALQQMFSRLENTLHAMKTENAALYRSLTENGKGAQYQRLKDSYNEAENLRQRIRWCRDQLDHHTSVIEGRTELLTRDGYAASAYLTASREIEESVEAIRKIRDEVAQNASFWHAKIVSWHGAMSGSPNTNSLGDEEHGEWVDTVLSWEAPKPVHTSVSASVLYPQNGNTLRARLSPIASALADSSETVTVDVVDKNSFGILLQDHTGNPVQGIPVTVSNSSLTETLTTDETGGVVFKNADRFAPNEDGEITLTLDYNADLSVSAYQRAQTEGASVQKGEFRTNALTAENGKPYIYSASFVIDGKCNDIKDTQYTAFFSRKNDQNFDIKIKTSAAGTVKLYYTDPNNKEQTVTKDTDANKEAVFTASWKKMVKPNTTMYAQIGDDDKIALKLGFVQGVAEEPITSLDNLSSVFNGLGLTFTIPGSKFGKPLGGMTFSINPPWETFLQIGVVGNLDGSFLAYVGGAQVGFDADLFRAKWKSNDQDALDQKLKGIEKKHFAAMADATNNEINRQYTNKPGHSIPVLGKFDLSISLGIGFLGRYRSAGAKDNYQYSFQVFLSSTINFDAGWQIFFCAAPPIYLDIHIQLSVMMSIRFAFYCNMDHGVKDVKADWGAWGISITVRLTLTIGLSFGLPGFVSFTIGGYCWIQITVSIPFGGGSRIEGLVSAGGGIFLEIKILFFKYRWNIVDSGEIVIWRFSAKERRVRPWYEALLSSAKADNTTAAQENQSSNMRPDSYPALAPDATPVLENIGLADSGVRLLQINGAMYLFYLDNQDRLVIHSMADGSDHYVTDGDRKIYSFDVTAQTCRDEFATVITDAYRGQDMVLISFASTTGFTEKKVTGDDGETHTFRVPNDTQVTSFLCLLQGGEPMRDLPVAYNGNIITAQMSCTTQTDQPMGNVQVSQFQGTYPAIPGVHGQILLNDALGDKNDSDRIIVQSFVSLFGFGGRVDTWQRVLLDQTPGTGNPYEQIVSADTTKGYNEYDVYNCHPNTIYTLQDGTLTRSDHLFEKAVRNITLSEGNVSFFTVCQVPGEPDNPMIFWLETEGTDAGLGNGDKVTRHLKAARLSNYRAVMSGSYDLQINVIKFQILGGQSVHG